MKNKIQVGEIMSTGWKLTIKNFLYFLGLLVILIVLNIIISIGNEILSKNTGFIVVLLYNLASQVFNMIISLGLIKICIDMVFGKKDPINTLFSVYRPVLKYFVSSILSGLITALPILFVLGVWGLGNIIMSRTGSQSMSLVSFNVILGILGLASVCYAIYMGTRLMFFVYFMVDKNTGIIESLKISFYATKGNFWKLVVLQLALFGANLLGAIALLVGLFLTVPMSMLATAEAYKRLSSDPAEEAIPVSSPAPVNTEPVPAA